MSFESRDWSSLTEVLLLAILRRFDTLKDFFTFRGVCRSWRAIAAPNPYSLASQPPLLLFNRAPGFTEVFCDVGSGGLYGVQFSWRVSSRRSIAYAHGYLVTATERPGAKLLLWNIFTGARIRLPKAPEVFDHVIFSSRPSYLGCLVLLFKRGKAAVLQYLRIGDPLWKVVHCCEPLDLLSDMIFFKNKIYALTDEMRLIAVDLVGGLKYEVLGDDKESPLLKRNHLRRLLAVSGDELLAICFKFRRRCEVFRWDFRSNDWEERLTLGGRTLFMGASGFVGSVAASEMRLKGDCIHSLDYLNGEWSRFSLKDQSVLVTNPLLPGLIKGPTTVPPVWVLPSIC